MKSTQILLLVSLTTSTPFTPVHSQDTTPPNHTEISPLIRAEPWCREGNIKQFAIRRVANNNHKEKIIDYCTYDIRAVPQAIRDTYKLYALINEELAQIMGVPSANALFGPGLRIVMTLNPKGIMGMDPAVAPQTPKLNDHGKPAQSHTATYNTNEAHGIVKISMGVPDNWLENPVTYDRIYAHEAVHAIAMQSERVGFKAKRQVNKLAWLHGNGIGQESVADYLGNLAIDRLEKKSTLLLGDIPACIRYPMRALPDISFDDPKLLFHPGKTKHLAMAECCDQMTPRELEDHRFANSCEEARLVRQNYQNRMQTNPPGALNSLDFNQLPFRKGEFYKRFDNHMIGAPLFAFLEKVINLTQGVDFFVPALNSTNFRSSPIIIYNCTYGNSGREPLKVHIRNIKALLDHFRYLVTTNASDPGLTKDRARAYDELWNFHSLDTLIDIYNEIDAFKTARRNAVIKLGRQATTAQKRAIQCERLEE